MIFKAALICFTVFMSFAANAQDNGAVGNPNGLQAPKTWDVNLGFSRDYTQRKNLSYYKIAFHGSTISEHGTMLVPSGLGNSWDMPRSGSDSDEFNFSLQDGVGQLSSPLVSAIGTKQFTLGGDFFKLFRGTVNVSGQVLENQRVNVGIGLETKPLTPLLSRSSLQITNHVQLGVLGDKVSGKGADTSQDMLLFTYRSYAGIGFQYVSSKNLEKMQADLIKLVESYSDDELQAMITQGSGSPELDTAFASIADVHHMDAEAWKSFRNAVKHAYSAQRDQPTFTIEAAADGTYAPVHFESRRYNALWNLSFVWWPDPKQPDNAKFTITYQNGYERGAPTQSLTGLIASFGFKF